MAKALHLPSTEPSTTSAIEPTADDRTPQQLLRHRRIQVGRLAVVLGVAALWILYPNASADVPSQLSFAAPFVVGAIAAFAVWIWLLGREGVLRERATLLDAGKKVGILLLWLILLGFLHGPRS